MYGQAINRAISCHPSDNGSLHINGTITSFSGLPLYIYISWYESVANPIESWWIVSFVQIDIFLQVLQADGGSCETLFVS